MEPHVAKVSRKIGLPPLSQVGEVLYLRIGALLPLIGLQDVLVERVLGVLRCGLEPSHLLGEVVHLLLQVETLSRK